MQWDGVRWSGMELDEVEWVGGGWNGIKCARMEGVVECIGWSGMEWDGVK